MFEKTDAGNPDDSSIMILKILDIGAIPIKIWNYKLVNLRNFETKKPKTKNQETQKPRNQETCPFASRGIPSTPQHTDSHPCARPHGLVSLRFGELRSVASEFRSVPNCLSSLFQVYLYNFAKKKTTHDPKNYVNCESLKKTQNSSCSSRCFILFDLTVHLL